MSKVPISVVDYIYSSIFYYPALYSRNTYEESRLAVLKHLFLVIGTGVEYDPETKAFSDGSKECIPQDIIVRLKDGEKTVVVSEGIYTKEVHLYKDFIKSDQKHLLKVKPSKDPMERLRQLDSKFKKAEIYPDAHNNYIKLLKKDKEDGCFQRPYPYSLEYTPMWDRQAKRLMDKKLILPEWREAIVEIYTWARDWMQSDKFDNDNYFNWSLKLDGPSCYFTEKWNNRKSTEQLCEDYDIPYKDYQNSLDMVKDIVAKQRKRYIDTAQLIIDTYS